MDFSGIKIPFQSIRFHSKFHTGKFNDVENTLLNLSATFIQVKKIKMWQHSSLPFVFTARGHSSTQSLTA